MKAPAHRHALIICGSLAGSLGLFVFVVLAGVIAESTVVREGISALPGVIGCLAVLLAGRWIKSDRPFGGRAVALYLPMLAFGLVNLIANQFSGFPGWSEAGLIVVGCMLAAAGEEWFFRGFLFQLLGRWSLALAVVVSSLVFGLFHFQQGLGIVVTTAGGLCFGLARAAGAGLWLLILAHACVNLPDLFPHAKRDFFSDMAIGVIASTFGVTLWFLTWRRSWLPIKSTKT